jgi:aryl-alcohol dehydrogenase-like predicted oxidoreductase
MKTDYVDLMQLHNPTIEQVEQGDLISALQDMKTQGKVRWIGCSSTLPDIAAYIEWGTFDVFQMPYSGLERLHETVITRAAAAGAGTIIRGSVARGAPDKHLQARPSAHSSAPTPPIHRLSTIRRTPPGRLMVALARRVVPRGWRNHLSMLLSGAADQGRKFEAAGLDELRGEGESRTAFLLRFLLTHPDAHTAIVGTLSGEHLKENVRAAQRGPLPADAYVEAKRRLDRIGEQPAA